MSLDGSNKTHIYPRIFGYNIQIFKVQSKQHFFPEKLINVTKFTIYNYFSVTTFFSSRKTRVLFLSLTHFRIIIFFGVQKRSYLFLPGHLFFVLFFICTHFRNNGRLVS